MLLTKKKLYKIRNTKLQSRKKYKKKQRKRKNKKRRRSFRKRRKPLNLRKKSLKNMLRGGGKIQYYLPYPVKFGQELSPISKTPYDAVTLHMLLDITIDAKVGSEGLAEKIIYLLYNNLIEIIPDDGGDFLKLPEEQTILEFRNFFQGYIEEILINSKEGNDPSIDDGCIQQQQDILKTPLYSQWKNAKAMEKISLENELKNKLYKPSKITSHEQKFQKADITINIQTSSVCCLNISFDEFQNKRAQFIKKRKGTPKEWKTTVLKISKIPYIQPITDRYSLTPRRAFVENPMLQTFIIFDPTKNPLPINYIFTVRDFLRFNRAQYMTIGDITVTVTPLVKKIEEKIVITPFVQCSNSTGDIVISEVTGKELEYIIVDKNDRAFINSLMLSSDIEHRRGDKIYISEIYLGIGNSFNLPVTQNIDHGEINMLISGPMNYKIPEEDIVGNIKKAIENKEQGPNTRYLINNWLVPKQQFRQVLTKKLNDLISLTQHMTAKTIGVQIAHNDGAISQRPQDIIIALKSAEEDGAEWETYSVTMPAGIIKTNIDESHVLHDNTEYIDMKTASLKDMEPIQTRNAGSREARYLHKDIIPFLNKMKVFPSFNGANTNFGKRLLFMYNTLTEVLNRTVQEYLFRIVSPSLFYNTGLFIAQFPRTKDTVNPFSGPYQCYIFLSTDAYPPALLLRQQELEHVIGEFLTDQDNTRRNKRISASITESLKKKREDDVEKLQIWETKKPDKAKFPKTPEGKRAYKIAKSNWKKDKKLLERAMGGPREGSRESSAKDTLMHRTYGATDDSSQRMKKQRAKDNLIKLEQREEEINSKLNPKIEEKERKIAEERQQQMIQRTKIDDAIKKGTMLIQQKEEKIGEMEETSRSNNEQIKKNDDRIEEIQNILESSEKRTDDEEEELKQEMRGLDQDSRALYGQNQRLKDEIKQEGDLVISARQGIQDKGAEYGMIETEAEQNIARINDAFENDEEVTKLKTEQKRIHDAEVRLLEGATDTTSERVVDDEEPEERERETPEEIRRFDDDPISSEEDSSEEDDDYFSPDASEEDTGGTGADKRGRKSGKRAYEAKSRDDDDDDDGGDGGDGDGGDGDGGEDGGEDGSRERPLEPVISAEGHPLINAETGLPHGTRQKARPWGLQNPYLDLHMELVPRRQSDMMGQPYNWLTSSYDLNTPQWFAALGQPEDTLRTTSVPEIPSKLKVPTIDKSVEPFVQDVLLDPEHKEDVIPTITGEVVEEPEVVPSNPPENVVTPVVPEPREIIQATPVQSATETTKESMLEKINLEKTKNNNQLQTVMELFTVLHKDFSELNKKDSLQAINDDDEAKRAKHAEIQKEMMAVLKFSTHILKKIKEMNGNLTAIKTQTDAADINDAGTIDTINQSITQYNETINENEILLKNLQTAGDDVREKFTKFMDPTNHPVEQTVVG